MVPAISENVVLNSIVRAAVFPRAVIQIADVEQRSAIRSIRLVDEPIELAVMDDSFRLIPAGHYVRGNTGPIQEILEKSHPNVPKAWQDPSHVVRITKPFYLSATKVTVGEFHQFVEATDDQTTAEKTEEQAVGSKPETHFNDIRFKQPFKRGDFTWRNPGFEQTDAHPVVCKAAQRF